MGAARAVCMLRGSALSALPCPGTSEQIQPALTYVLGVWGGRGGGSGLMSARLSCSAHRIRGVDSLPQRGGFLGHCALPWWKLFTCTDIDTKHDRDQERNQKIGVQNSEQNPTGGGGCLGALRLALVGTGASGAAAAAAGWGLGAKAAAAMAAASALRASASACSTATRQARPAVQCGVLRQHAWIHILRLDGVQSEDEVPHS